MAECKNSMVNMDENVINKTVYLVVLIDYGEITHSCSKVCL